MRRPTRSSSERGISLVEMLVVLLIIAILSAIGIQSIASSRASGRSALAVAAAHAYADAADRFAREHAGRYPAAAPSRDWPGATRDKGPVADVLGTKKYYLARAPEGIQDKSVTLATGATTTGASIQYVVENGGRGYRFVVRVEGRPTCAVRGGMATSTTPRNCSAR